MGENGTKYLAVFVLYPNDNHEKFIDLLLCCSPLFDESDSTALNQIETIKANLLKIGKCFDDISVLFGDNTSVNLKIAR